MTLLAQVLSTAVMGTRCDGPAKRSARGSHNGASTAKVGDARMQVSVHGGTGSIRTHGVEPITSPRSGTVAECTSDSSVSRDEGNAQQINNDSSTHGMNMPIDTDDDSRLSATAPYGCSYEEKDGRLIGGEVCHEPAAPDSCNQQGQMHNVQPRSFFIVPEGTTPSVAAASYRALPQPVLGQWRRRLQPAGQRSPSADMVPQDTTTLPLKKRRKNH